MGQLNHLQLVAVELVREMAPVSGGEGRRRATGWRPAEKARALDSQRRSANPQSASRQVEGGCLLLLRGRDMEYARGVGALAFDSHDLPGTNVLMKFIAMRNHHDACTTYIR